MLKNWQVKIANKNRRIESNTIRQSSIAGVFLLIELVVF